MANDDKPEEVYDIFPKNPGESRVVGDFEFAFVKTQNHENHFTYRYIPKPGQDPKEYTIPAPSVSVYAAPHRAINLSRPQEHTIYVSYYYYRNRRPRTNNPVCLLSGVYSWPVPARKALERAYDLDHGAWKKMLREKKRVLDKTMAESLGITLSEYRKQVAATNKADRAIRSTSDEMEVSMYLVSLKDKIDSVLGAMKHQTLSLDKLWEFRKKMNGFSGPLWVRARSLGLKQEKSNKKKK